MIVETALFALALVLVDPVRAEAPIPPLFPDPAPFESAICAARTSPVSAPVTGLIVPHHLLAADLIARGFALAAGRRPERIVLVMPDHFKRSATPVAVCARDVDTCFGRVPADAAAVRALTGGPVAESSLFSHDHALQALAPFIAKHFPHVPLVAVAIRASAGPAEWTALEERLAPFTSPAALMVQSTDLSHYLGWDEARRRDQRTLNVLCAEEPGEVAALDQPAHTDGRGALHAMMALQKRIGAHPVVVESRNSSEYAREAVAHTTSYAVALYGTSPIEVDGGTRIAFAGDTFTGRYMAARLHGAVERAQRATHGVPLVVNLEGAFGDAPRRSGPWTLAMPPAPALAALTSLGVRAASLANNHARDLGDAAREETRRALGVAGIAGLMPGTTTDLGPCTVSALTDCDNADPQRARLLTTGDLAALPAGPPGKPWIAFLHAGTEWVAGPGSRELDLARRLGARGVGLVVACHPHVAGPLVPAGSGLLAASLGNFLFDQTDPRAGGALCEVRVFRQGTFAVRLLPLGNLYRGGAGPTQRPIRSSSAR